METPIVHPACLGAPRMHRLDQRFQIGPCIGRGGVGEVHQGWQVALDRPVAIKLLRPELTRSPAAVARFEREARTTGLLNHPNVVTVIDVGEADDGTRYVAMELLEGTTLAELLDRAGPLPVDRALHICRQIARGMGAGQGVGLVHRDLKPDNIFVLDGDHVKVLDFGLATLLEPDRGATPPGPTPSDPPELAAADATVDTTDDLPALGPRPRPDSAALTARLTRPGALMGTPRYMAPEQVLGWGVDHRTDLYSFGCILFEMLAGRTPFPGPGPRDFMRQHLHTPAPALSELRPDLPPAMVRLVGRLLEKAPSDRFRDWSALLDALRLLDASARSPADGTLQAAARSHPPEPQPTEPYRFLHPFTRANRAIFFGREADAVRFREAWEHPDRPALVLLTGASGVGKTSFLSARVVPALEDTGHTVLRVRGTADPLHQLHEALGRQLEARGQRAAGRGLPSLLDQLVRDERRPIAVVLDQLEELFTQGDAGAAQSLQAGLASVLSGGDSSVRFILSVREDYLGATLRALHPLPLDTLARTLPLRALEAADLREALDGPGREGLPVAYPPFRFEDGLLDEIVADLLRDTAGEVTPRVQAVGARLWEMVRGTPRPHVIRRAHYRDRLGSARGILARILDEAIGGLDAADQGVAKEMLRALTHLPGSPTSRPAPESALTAHATAPVRRAAVLRELEDRWRVIHGFLDPRRPGERSYRIAHEALIFRIQQYGEEGTGRNRARQLFHQGHDLWLQGGRREEDLLPEQHLEEIRREIEDLVLRSADEREFYEKSKEKYDDSYMARHLEDRRRAFRDRAQVVLLPTVVLAMGFLLGQAAAGFVALQTLRAQLLSALHVPKADLRGAALRGAALDGANLHEADLSGADLREAVLAGADLELAVLADVQLGGADLRGANLRGARITGERLWDTRFDRADLRMATLDVDPAGARFDLAIFDHRTAWGRSGPPPGAVGPRGEADGLIADGARLTRVDLSRISLRGARLFGADLSGSVLEDSDLTEANLKQARLRETRFARARLAGATLAGADLEGADLHGADLRGANLQGARLVRARLAEADLSGADLCDADLTGAELIRAELAGAQVCEGTRWPEGQPLPGPARRGR